MCRDWNLVQDFDLDTFNYIRINNPLAKNRLSHLKQNLNLIDPWRELYPLKKSFSWRQPNPVKMARLDFFLVTKELMSVIDKLKIVPGYKTDHSLISLSLNLEKIHAGKGYWTFNNSLLKDEEYIQKIKHVIKENIVMYSVDEVSYDELELDKCNFENYRFSIDDQLFFNTLLMMIRGETILYSSVKKERGVENETKLEKEISDLETKSIYDVHNKEVIEELED